MSFARSLSRTLSLSPYEYLPGCEVIYRDTDSGESICGKLLEYNKTNERWEIETSEKGVLLIQENQIVKEVRQPIQFWVPLFVLAVLIMIVYCTKYSVWLDNIIDDGEYLEMACESHPVIRDFEALYTPMGKVDMGILEKKVTEWQCYFYHTEKKVEELQQANKGLVGTNNALKASKANLTHSLQVQTELVRQQGSTIENLRREVEELRMKHGNSQQSQGILLCIIGLISFALYNQRSSVSTQENDKRSPEILRFALPDPRIEFSPPEISSFVESITPTSGPDQVGKPMLNNFESSAASVDVYEDTLENLPTMSNDQSEI